VLVDRSRADPQGNALRSVNDAAPPCRIVCYDANRAGYEALSYSTNTDPLTVTQGIDPFGRRPPFHLPRPRRLQRRSQDCRPRRLQLRRATSLPGSRRPTERREETVRRGRTSRGWAENRKTPLGGKGECSTDLRHGQRTEPVPTWYVGGAADNHAKTRSTGGGAADGESAPGAIRRPRTDYAWVVSASEHRGGVPRASSNPLERRIYTASQGGR